MCPKTTAFRKFWKYHPHTQNISIMTNMTFNTSYIYHKQQPHAKYGTSRLYFSKKLSYNRPLTNHSVSSLLRHFLKHGPLKLFTQSDHTLLNILYRLSEWNNSVKRRDTSPPANLNLSGCCKEFRNHFAVLSFLAFWSRLLAYDTCCEAMVVEKIDKMYSPWWTFQRKIISTCHIFKNTT